MHYPRYFLRGTFRETEQGMATMDIPTGYAVLTAGLTGFSLLCLIVAGWSRKKAAVSAAVGVCVVTSIFVIDVITDGTVMGPRLAIVLVGAAVVLIFPMVGAVLKGRPSRAAKTTQPSNPPDSRR
jgi:hypothetical protein